MLKIYLQIRNVCIKLILQTRTDVRNKRIGVKTLEGIAKVIEELGLLILSKEAELKVKDKELTELKEKIELVENYLETYEEFYNKR